MQDLIENLIITGKMEREVFHYMKYDCAPMPYNDDDVFESELVENQDYVIPQVRTFSDSILYCQNYALS